MSLAAPPVTDRDFRGYGASPPAIRWPNDARLAVSIVVNIFSTCCRHYDPVIITSIVERKYKQPC